MKFKLLTIFPEMLEAVLDTSILARARKSGAIETQVIDIRPFSQNKHKNTDDAPFGGGAGMVMTPQPTLDALRYACGDGVGFLRFSITDGTNILEEETNEANLYGYFKMPNKSITVNAYFEAGSIPIGHAAVTGVGSVGYQVNYFGVDGLDFGDWHLPGVLEGSYLMADATLAALAPSISKMGTSAINNSTHRWFAERCNVGNAWLFYGGSGSLDYYYVYSAYRCQAVALLNIG